MTQKSDVCDRRPRGKHLFSFAVVADTHVNEAEDVCLSPFATNSRANARARHVFAEIAGLDPALAFVIHLGDIVHPVPAMPSFDEAARRFKAIAAPLTVPLHLVPGNHDVGDKRIDWMPADIVCDDYLAKYREVFGADYYAMDRDGVRFLFLNALLFNSGLAADTEQREWIDAQLSSAPGRIVVSLHYPPYIHDARERGSYDNIDQPGRDWLLERLRDPRVEMVLCGHVHNFWYDTVGAAEMYMLPSTAFLRHDFTEFYRVSPGEEYGRGDVQKFGYFIVDVHEFGHVARLVRTHGDMRVENSLHTRVERLPGVHTKTAGNPRFAAETRHPWAEEVEIPCTGGVQEFGRKLARNDYPLMAMWEMGLQALKIPVQDLRNPTTLARAVAMSNVGHLFTLTSLGLPDAALVAAAEKQGIRIAAIELNLTTQHLARVSRELEVLKQTTSARLIFCKIRTGEDDAHYDGKHYSHFVNTGLRLPELAGAAAWLQPYLCEKRLDGVTVRLDWGADLLATHAALVTMAGAWDCEFHVGVKLADQLAKANEDDVAIAVLAAHACLAARTEGTVHYAFDTFMDVDRGYFPRNGFIDRRFDPRPAAVTVASLNGLLADVGAIAVSQPRSIAGVEVISVEAQGLFAEMVDGPADAVRRHQADSGAVRTADLFTGTWLTGGGGSNAAAGAGRRVLRWHELSLRA